MMQHANMIEHMIMIGQCLCVHLLVVSTVLTNIITIPLLNTKRYTCTHTQHAFLYNPQYGYL